MKCAVEASDLLTALSLIDKVIETKKTIPILNNVKLTVADGALHLTGTNLDMECRTRIPAADCEDGATTVLHADLKAFVRLLPPDATVKFAATKTTLAASSGRHRRSFQTLPAGDFPDFNDKPFSHKFKTNLKRLFTPARVASTEATRWYLAGVFVHETDGKLVSVATNGTSLIKCTAEAPDGSVGMPGVIIPTVASGAFLALGDEPEIELSAAIIRASNASSSILSKLIDGTFPDYARLMPRHDRSALFDAEELSKALQIAGTAAQDQERLVCLSLSNGLCEISNGRQISGNSASSTECEYEGERRDLGVNWRYLVEMIAASGAETIRFEFSDGNTPFTVTPTTRDDFIGLVFPVRLARISQEAEAA